MTKRKDSVDTSHGSEPVLFVGSEFDPENPPILGVTPTDVPLLGPGEYEKKLHDFHDFKFQTFKLWEPVDRREYCYLMTQICNRHCSLIERTTIPITEHNSLLVHVQWVVHYRRYIP